MSSAEHDASPGGEPTNFSAGDTLNSIPPAQRPAVSPTEVDRRAPDARTAMERTGSRPVPGRLAVITSMSLAVGAVPLPVLPEKVIGVLRGAVAHEVIGRHGLSLTMAARETLAEADSSGRMSAVLRRAAEIFAGQLLRRLGPLGPLSALDRALEVYALGHLLNRYCVRVRNVASSRVEQPEAERVRRMINRAVLLAFSPTTATYPLHVGEGGEDLRDSLTRWVDAALLGVATLPSYITRRLDAAFDDITRDAAGAAGAAGEG